METTPWGNSFNTVLKDVEDEQKAWVLLQIEKSVFVLMIHLFLRIVVQVVLSV